MANLQLQAATGKRLNRPSDDPTAISPVLSARTQIQTSDRYIETIDSGLDRIDNMDGTFAHIENVLQRVREIAIAGVDGALSPQDMVTYGDEVAQLKDELLDAANAQVDGKFLFAGYETKTKPFVANPAYNPLTYNPAIYDPATNPPPVLYQGDAGQLEMEIAPNELVRVGVDGGSFFLGLQDTNSDGIYDNSDSITGSDLFHQLSLLEADLKANNPASVSTRIASLDPAIEQARTQRSLLGNIGARLETARGHMEDIQIDMQEMRSRYEDADILDTITKLKQQQQAFEGALNVTGQVSQLSILNFLR
jgi:flagellar hook-associated protein 3 FlgL